MYVSLKSHIYVKSCQEFLDFQINFSTDIACKQHVKSGHKKYGMLQHNLQMNE